jgi:hypothetical protein
MVTWDAPGIQGASQGDLASKLLHQPTVHAYFTRRQEAGIGTFRQQFKNWLLQQSLSDFEGFNISSKLGH